MASGIVSLGFGSWGSVSLVVTGGYVASIAQPGCAAISSNDQAAANVSVSGQSSVVVGFSNQASASISITECS